MSARLVGINHVALEVGDIEQALQFYGSLFEISLRGRGPSMAFIDMGDQFIALSRGREQPPDEARHFGLVVDDREAVRAALAQRGIEVAPEGSVDFNDPWGNHIQVVDYRDIQFAKTPAALRAVGGEHLAKRPGARREMGAKGLLDEGYRGP
jgi:lactoylglutathione lyase